MTPMSVTAGANSLPTGTVTLLFTDIEGSTKLWDAHPEAMRVALARHDALVREAIVSANGYVFKTVGDAFCAAFAMTTDAVAAALMAQMALHTEPWPEATLSLPDRKQAPTPQSLSIYESVRLFIDRALLVRPEFQVTNQNAPALASLCYHLDGIPLAIELAAARVRSLSVEEIDGKLDQRFRLLTGGSRTALPRQQTLRSLIDWSYDLLREPEKLLLQRLSVFAGGWTLAAAEEVCADEGVERGNVLDLLTSLADKNLVVPEQEDAHTRCRLLETLRQYARDRLEDTGGSAAVRVRHRDYYLALAEEADPKLKGAEQAEWLKRLEEEHENLRAGLACSLAEAETGGGLRLCGALQRFWWTRGYLSEGRQWCMGVLCKAGAEERTRERANVLNAAGVLAKYQGDYPAARALHEESLAIRRELGDRLGIAASLNSLGAVAQDQGDYPATRALSRRAWRSVGNWGIGSASPRR